jgi:hypothetical protein
MNRQLVALVLAGLTAAGCSSPSRNHSAPTTKPALPSATVLPAESPTTDIPDDRPPAAGCTQGQPAPKALVKTVESGSIPDGALKVTEARMIRYRRVYWIVVARATDPDGKTQRASWLYAPWSQTDIGNGGQVKTIGPVAAAYQPMVPAVDDAQAIQIAESFCDPTGE